MSQKKLNISVLNTVTTAVLDYLSTSEVIDKEKAKVAFKKAMSRKQLGFSFSKIDPTIQSLFVSTVTNRVYKASEDRVIDARSRRSLKDTRVVPSMLFLQNENVLKIICLEMMPSVVGDSRAQALYEEIEELDSKISKIVTIQSKLDSKSSIPFTLDGPSGIRLSGELPPGNVIKVEFGGPSIH